MGFVGGVIVTSEHRMVQTVFIWCYEGLLWAGYRLVVDLCRGHGCSAPPSGPPRLRGRVPERTSGPARIRGSAPWELGVTRLCNSISQYCTVLTLNTVSQSVALAPPQAQPPQPPARAREGREVRVGPIPIPSDSPPATRRPPQAQRAAVAGGPEPESGRVKCQHPSPNPKAALTQHKRSPISSVTLSSEKVPAS